MGFETYIFGRNSEIAQTEAGALSLFVHHRNHKN